MEAYIILTWNVNQRGADVLGFSQRNMFERLQGEKVFLLQETAVKSAVEPEWNARLPNHNLYFSKDDGHGLIIGIVRTIKSKYDCQISYKRQGQLLFVSAELDGPGSLMTTLICAYFRPKCQMLGSLALYLRTRLSLGNQCRRVLFAGDLNAKFGNLMCTAGGLPQNDTVDAAGEYLADLFTKLGFRMINGNVPGHVGDGTTYPKRKTMRHGSRLDYVLVSGYVENVVSMHFSHWMGSDHVAVLALWKPNPTKLLPAIMGVEYTTYCG